MELFRLVGSILVDNEKANASISKTDSKAESLAKKFASGATTVAKWGTAIAGASTLVGGALLGVANSSASAMDEIDKMSAKIGISKKGYQEWKYVLGQNGMEISNLQSGMKTLVAQMDGASNGTKSAKENFAKLGVSIYDSTGKMKDQETVMSEVLFSLADMENGTEKARLATELFGKSGSEMMPMLNNGSESMAELTARAHELGLVVSDDAVSAGVTFGDTMDDLKQSFGMVVTNIGNNLIPIFQKIADWVMDNMPQIQETIGKVINTISIVFAGLVDAISYLWESGLKTTFEGIINFIDGVFTGDWEKALEGVKQVFGGIFSTLKDLASVPLNALSEFVMGIVEKIKGFFNFTISFPDIKLPHFSITPKGWEIGDLLKGKIPKLGIEWYAKAMDDGMILNGPTIFGASNGKLLGGGEAGSEVIVGKNSLLNMIQQASAQSNSSLAQILLEILDIISNEDKLHRILVKALTDGNFKVELDGREVGRIVRTYA